MSFNNEKENVNPESKLFFDQEDTPTAIKSKRKLSYRKTDMRWLALTFQCFLLIGQRFCFDNPQALQFYLTNPNSMNLSSTQYNLLYSVYSISNIFLPFFGGIIIDRLSVRVAIFLFSTIIIIGQFIFLIGGWNQSFGALLVGRLIFGMGGECIAVCQSSVIVKWFKNKDLGLALSMGLGCNRIGSLLNSFLTPRLYAYNDGYVLPIFVGLILCIFSWFCGLAINYMDRISDRREGKLSLLIEEERDELKKEESINKNSKNVINIDVFLNFNRLFWLLVIVCTLTYGSLYTFTGNVNDLLCKVFGLSNILAGSYITFIYLSSSILLPICGLFIDKYGKRIYVMITAILLFLLTHLLLIFFDRDINSSTTLIPILICGTFYALFGAFIWNSISLVVEPSLLGISYGIQVSLLNLNLVISPLIYGFIHDSTTSFRSGYFWSEIFLIGEILIALFLAVIAGYYNKSNFSGILNKPTLKKDAFESIRASMSYMSFGG